MAIIRHHEALTTAVKGYLTRHVCDVPCRVESYVNPMDYNWHVAITLEGVTRVAVIRNMSHNQDWVDDMNCDFSELHDLFVELRLLYS